MNMTFVAGCWVKEVPGAGWKWLVYDQRDRQVFSQDANLSAKK